MQLVVLRSCAPKSRLSWNLVVTSGLKKTRRMTLPEGERSLTTYAITALASFGKK